MDTTSERPERRRLVAWLSTGLQRSVELEWLAVAVAAPLLLFPTVRPRWTAAALCALMAVWLLRWFVRREPWPVTPFNGALLLFVLMIPVAMWASALPELTLPKATGLVLGLAAFRAVALTARDRRSFGLALTAFCLLGLVIAVIGVLAAQWLEKVAALTALTSRIPRLITSLPELPTAGVHPNEIAGALMLYLPLAAALVGGWSLCRRVRVLSPLLLAGCVAFLMVVAGVWLLTQSRSGWFGGVAGLLTLGVSSGLSSHRRWLRLLGVALPVLVLAAAVAGLIYVGPQRVGEILYGTGSDALMEGAVGSISMAGRIEVWNRALYAIQDFPFTGCGLGTFRRVVQVLYPLFLAGPDQDIAHAHNIFLQVALDLGLPGLIAYLALLMVAGTVCWRVANSPSLRVGRGGRGVRVIALGLLAGLVGLHVYGLADALALGAKPGVAFWLALGLIAALPRVAEQEAAEAVERRSRGAEERRSRRLWWIVVLAAVVLLMAAGGHLGWHALRQGSGPLAQPSIRLPLYPDAQGANVRTESPPADSGWVGLLEVATFTTTQSITDVVVFYTSTLAGSGWQTEMEAGDATSWGGIYTRDEGRSVCMLNVFAVEGEAWVSIVCGDKSEPVDLPPLSPLPAPTASP
jgi:putative inorganic carbon (HCO3(-)) transporter